MKVTMLLADAAQAVDNKLYVLGGGWSVTGPDPAPSAIALKIDVPWDQANMALTLVGALAAVLVTNSAVGVLGGFGAPGFAAPVLAAVALLASLAINVSPLPLPPGRRYVWQLTIDGQSAEDWQLPFTTRPQP